jgi:hypothetical protein
MHSRTCSRARRLVRSPTMRPRRSAGWTRSRQSSGTPSAASSPRSSPDAASRRGSLRSILLRSAAYCRFPISSLKSALPVLGNPANRHRAVPLTFDQFRYAFANAVSEEEAKELHETFAVPASGAPLFQAAAEPEPVDGGQGRHREPRAWPPAGHLGGEGQHRAVGGREPGLQAPTEERRRHGDRRDAGPRARAGHRQRLARGGRHGPRLRQALHLSLVRSRNPGSRRARSPRGPWAPPSPPGGRAQ